MELTERILSMFSRLYPFITWKFRHGWTEYDSDGIEYVIEVPTLLLEARNGGPYVGGMVEIPLFDIDSHSRYRHIRSAFRAFHSCYGE